MTRIDNFLLWLSFCGLLVLAGCQGAGAPPESREKAGEEAGIESLGDDKGWVRRLSVWSNPVIPVCWEATPADQKLERDWVQDAAERSWDAHSRVDFTGWGQCAPRTSNSVGIRIAVVHQGAATSGLGTRISGVKNGMRLNFAYQSWNAWCAKTEDLRERCIRANAVHEFGHALAFAHEHNRHDRPSACTERHQGTDGDLILTPWDPESIMNYCNKARMQQGGRLSAGDIASVQAVYGT